MNSYTLADITPGMTESFTVTVTEAMMDAFYAVSGDNSPIHMDADYAAGRGYPGRVSVEAKFAKPVFIGDTLTVTGKVTEVNDTFGEITIKAVIENQNGQKVTRGLIKAGVAK